MRNSYNWWHQQIKEKIICLHVISGFVKKKKKYLEATPIKKFTLLFLAGVGLVVLVPIMYGGRGEGLQPPRCHIFGAGGFQSVVLSLSAGTLVKERERENFKQKENAQTC